MQSKQKEIILEKVLRKHNLDCHFDYKGDGNAYQPAHKMAYALLNKNDPYKKTFLYLSGIDICILINANDKAQYTISGVGYANERDLIKENISRKNGGNLENTIIWLNTILKDLQIEIDNFKAGAKL